MYALIEVLHIKQDKINEAFFYIINKDELLKDITPLKDNKGGVINE